jgi:hypothetical protein
MKMGLYEESVMYWTDLRRAKFGYFDGTLS